MKPDVLAVSPLYAKAQDALEREFTVHRLWEAEDRDALLAEVGPRVRAISTTGGAGADAALIDRLPKLEVIGCFGVGYDAVDVDHASKRGIAVTNTPDVLNDAVADLTLGLMLAICRRIPQADRFLREGRWPAGPFPLTGHLGGRSVGILGLGRIGKEIAKRASAFGMQVAYHGRRAQADQPYRFYADLTEMAGAVDYLVVVIPGGAETQALVSRQVMAALGPEGTLVNVARGSVVDEAAMIELLSSGKLGAAALDVFADEPNVPATLRQLDNVVLQPHLGSATHDTRFAMGDLVVRNLRAHFAGAPLLTPVNQPA
jgi:lactate dehydrogenase-like 2-hydroxyacid dehydrogenase